VRDESIARGGQIVDYQNLSIWRAAAISPIQYVAWRRVALRSMGACTCPAVVAYR
jgi:hypothetical protein